MFSTIQISPKQLAYEVTSKLNHRMFCVTVMFRHRLGEVRIATTTNAFGNLAAADQEQRLQVVTNSYSRLFKEGFLPVVLFTAAPVGAPAVSTVGLQTLLTKDETSLTKNETAFSLLCECAPQLNYGSLLDLKYLAGRFYLRKLKPLFSERAATQAAVASVLAAGGKVLDFNRSSPFPVPGRNPSWQKDFVLALPATSTDTKDNGSAKDPE